jgi:hypothetical protein
VEEVLSGGRRVGTSGTEKEVGKGCGKVNIVQILIHVFINEKMIPVETIPGRGISQDK